MPDYQKLYHKTFNAITDVERLLEKAKTILQTIQQECEDSYIKDDDFQTPDELNNDVIVTSHSE